MTLKEKIYYLHSLRVPLDKMSELLDMSYEELDRIVTHNGWYNGAKIRTIPTLRIIEWLRAGMSIQDIADTVGCSTKAVGKTLATRQLNPADYTAFNPETLPKP